MGERVSGSKRELILAEYKALKSYRAVARSVGVSPGTVKAHVKKCEENVQGSEENICWETNGAAEKTSLGENISAGENAALGGNVLAGENATLGGKHSGAGFIDRRRERAQEFVDMCFDVLADRDKLEKSPINQITSAMGTMLDKFADTKGKEGLAEAIESVWREREDE